MSTIAQREENLAAVMALRGLGFKDAASRVRVNRERRVILDESLFAELVQQAQPVKAGDRVHILEQFDKPGMPDGTVKHMAVLIDLDNGGSAIRTVTSVERI